MTGTAVVLFTRDLRVHDQPGLGDAARRGERAAPLFVLDDRLLRDHGANRLAFLLAALEDLRASLRALGAELAIRRGDPVRETIGLAREVGAGAVIVSRDVSGYAGSREARLRAACEAERLELRVHPATVVVPPGDLAPVGGDHYRVFTPYWRRWRELLPGRTEPSPRGLRAAPIPNAGHVPAIRELRRSAPSPDLPPGGEREGRRRLERWLRSGLPGYHRRRDDLAADATSHLSAYLHFGCLSAREVARRAEARAGGAALVRQLCWRDFFAQLLARHPETPRDDLRPRGDRWRADDEALARWREGRTGVPIVDAGMRQLAREGWMHNRARLLVGSYLCKTLYLDWRHGERHFFDLLVDGDVASNVGNWQWVAGTGADTRPNRVLDPLAQARRFDPDGDYVRRHVPELAEVAGPSVHTPWRLGSGVPPEYPPPIVDHAEASSRFRAARALRARGRRG